MKAVLSRSYFKLVALGYAAFEAESGDFTPLQEAGDELLLHDTIRQSAQVLDNNTGKRHFAVQQLAVFERLARSRELGLVDLGKFGCFELVGSVLVEEGAEIVPPVILYELKGSSGRAFMFWGGLYALPLLLIQETQKCVYLFHDSYSVQPKVQMLHASNLLVSFRRRKLKNKLLPGLEHGSHRKWLPTSVPKTGSALLFGFSNNFGHYIWNELSGIYDLIISGLIDRIGCVIVGQYDFCDFAALLESLYGIKIHRVPLRSEKRLCGMFADLMADTGCLLLRFNNVVLTDAFCSYLRDKLFHDSEMDCREEASVGKELFNVCFKVRLHNRVCQNQIDLVLALLRYFEQSVKDFVNDRVRKVRFFIDGFSSYAHMSPYDRDIVRREKELFAGIAQRCSDGLGESVELIDMIGLTVLQKASIARDLDLYLSPVGSGGELYTWVYKVPSIYYGLPDMIELAERHAQGLVESLPRISLVQAQPVGKTGSVADYMLPPEILLRVVAGYLQPA